MTRKQNRFFRYLRLAFVVLAFVLYPYFVNQMPILGLVKNAPPIVIVFWALVFAAIVVVGPELLNPQEISSEDLWREFWAKNQETINKRLKNSLDQGSHIDLINKDSPADLARPQSQVKSSSPSENPKSQSPFGKGWRSLFKGLQSPPIWPGMPTFPRIEARRELQNLQTQEITNLAASKPILEIFEEANRRLLILGEPGSGKTTELLKLAQALGELAENNPKQPIPIIFELSVWRGEPMLDWMTEEMEARYGLKRQLCREWLIGDRIVPLLDGLDELGKYSDGLKEAILAIDTLQEHNDQQQKALVICCRIEDYESIKDDENQRIRLRKVDRAVRLCELNDIQIQDYLKKRQATHIWEELLSNKGFKDLAKSPMLLNLMPITYPDGLPENAPLHPDVCQKRLFEDFLARKLQPTQRVSDQPLQDYDPQKARHYLAWLAASMGREGINQREFLIEGLQPIWLENQRQLKQYRLIGGLIFGLIVGLIFGLIFGLIVGLIGWLIVGLIFDYDTIQLTESLDLSWQGIKRGLSSGLRYALIFGLIFGLIGGLIIGLIGGLIFGLIGGLIIGLIFGLIGGLIFGLKADLKVRTRPNQGIGETGIKTLMTIGLAMPLCPLMFIVPNWAMGQQVNLAQALIQGGGMGVLFGFYLGGGVALVQHFSLRWVLYRQGQMPWNYAKFLTAASQAGILKQSGGRFRFYHDKLREHLAKGITLEIESKPIDENAAKSKPLIKLNPWVSLCLESAKIPTIVVLSIVIFTSTFSFNKDSVTAMNPVIQTSDKIWYDRLTYPRWRSPHRNDIISFSSTNLAVKFPYELATRRILAIPGETLEIRQDQIIINNKAFTDSTIKLPANFKQLPITLGSDEYYVIGDNPNYPNPKTFGAVIPRQNIKGQLVLRLYPFNRVGFLQ